MKFKVRFPGVLTLQVKDVWNDNLDAHLILGNGEVYFCIIITPKNISELLTKKDFPGYYCQEDDFVVADLSEETIQKSFINFVKEHWEYNWKYIDKYLTHIGNIQKIYEVETFEEVKAWFYYENL